MPTVTQQLSIEELSALYDRVYDIADRLFKKYNPCNIQVKNNKTKCVNKHYNRNHLCCQWWSDRCRHWDNKCTTKCLGCKVFICEVFICGHIRNKNGLFVIKIHRLQKIASKLGLPTCTYYLSKEDWLKRIISRRKQYDATK